MQERIINVTSYSDAVKGFVGATLRTAMLDSGCTKNVCGKTWMACYLETLSTDDARNVKQNPMKILSIVGGQKI